MTQAHELKNELIRQLGLGGETSKNSNEHQSLESQVSSIAQGLGVNFSRLNQYYLRNWFNNGISGKKIVLVGDSTTEFAYGLIRPLQNKYARPGRELDGVGIYNYGQNGQTLSAWLADTTTRYGSTGCVNANADLYIFSYGINDVRTGTSTEAQLLTNLDAAIDLLKANGADVLLWTPPTFTTTDTGSNAFVVPNASAQAYSTIMWNAYRRCSIAKGCALVDTQSLIFGLTSKSATLSPYMLNQIHANDAGYNLVAQEIVKVIGAPTKNSLLLFGMSGKVGVGSLGRVVVPTATSVAVGNAVYVPSSGSGSLTMELRQYVGNIGGAVVLGTMTITAGTGSSAVFSPGAAADLSALALGDGLEIAVTACTMTAKDLEVEVLSYPAPRASAYPLYLRYNGIASPVDGSLTYTGTDALTSAFERDIRGLKAVKFYRLGTNLITKYDADFSQSVWSKTTCTVSGTARSQVITATGAAAICYTTVTVTASTQYTFSWKGTTTSATPKFAIYDFTGSAFITSPTAWPAAGGDGWRSVTFTTPVGCVSARMYVVGQPGGGGVNGDTYTVSATQLNTGAVIGTYAPTNSIGTSMIVPLGATLPSEFTRITFIKVDGAVTSSIAVISPGGPDAAGNPALQAQSSTTFGYPVITPRGTAPKSITGAWEVATFRYTGGKGYVSVNDQAQASGVTFTLNAQHFRYNLLSSTDTTGSFQNWDGELIDFYFPYLLTEGEIARYIRSTFRTLNAAGETITSDIPIERLI